MKKMFSAMVIVSLVGITNVFAADANSSIESACKCGKECKCAEKKGCGCKGKKHDKGDTNSSTHKH